jgi:hypothetical protein
MGRQMPANYKDRTPDNPPGYDTVGPRVPQWLTEARERLTTIWHEPWSAAEVGRQQARKAKEARDA